MTEPNDTIDLMGSTNDMYDTTEDHAQPSRPAKKAKSGGFHAFNLSPAVSRGIASIGFRQPTPIQRRTIPSILAGNDVVAMARTGSGKTATFLIPMIEKLSNMNNMTTSTPTTFASNTSSTLGWCLGLILSPTRELATQTFKVFRLLSKHTPLTSCLLVGGDTMSSQFADLEQHPNVIVATPGRLVHMLLEMKFSLKAVRFIVFDEADRLFEMGFAIQLHEILKKMSDTDYRQTCLFSATLPPQLIEFSRAGLKADAQLIRLDADTKVSPSLRLQFFTVRKDLKPAALLYLLRNVLDTNAASTNNNQTIIFCATKHHVEFLTQFITVNGIEACGIYGTMDATARKINLAKFRAGKASVLVVTDLAARGLDIPLLDNVINYDFVSKVKMFIHRTGRVARAGRTGTAYSLLSIDELPYAIDLHLFLGRKLQNQPEPGVTYDVHDAQQVYYGSLPTHDVELLNETVQQTVADHQLERQYATAERAYKLYYKTRAAASNASMDRAKQLIAERHGDFHSIPMHPMFQHIASTSSVIPITTDSATAASLLAAVHNYKPAVTIFEINNHVNDVMKTKRAEHQIIIAKQTGDVQRSKRASGTAADGNVVDADDSMEGLDIDEAKEGSSNEDEAGDDADADDDDSPASTSASTIVSDNKSTPLTTTNKPRLTAKQRKMAKKLAQNGDVTLAEALQLSKQSTDHVVKEPEQKSYRDEKFFVSADMPDNYDAEQDGYSLRAAATRMDPAGVDMMADEAEEMMKVKKMQKWDAKKKNYVTQQVGGDPFKKLRDDHSGQRVVRGPAKDLKTGQIIKSKGDNKSSYKEWKKRSGASKREAAMMDDDDNNADTSKQRGKPTFGRPDKKRGRSEDSREEFFKKQRQSADKQGKREIRGVDDIRASRKKKEINKLRNRKGGVKGTPQKGRGGPSKGRSNAPSHSAKGWNKSKGKR